LTDSSGPGESASSARRTTPTRSVTSSSATCRSTGTRDRSSHQPEGRPHPLLQGVKSILDVEDVIDLVNISVAAKLIPRSSRLRQEGGEVLHRPLGGFKEVAPRDQARAGDGALATSTAMRIFGPTRRAQNADPEISSYANFTFVPMPAGQHLHRRPGGGMGDAQAAPLQGGRRPPPLLQLRQRERPHHARDPRVLREGSGDARDHDADRVLQGPGGLRAGGLADHPHKRSSRSRRGAPARVGGGGLAHRTLVDQWPWPGPCTARRAWSSTTTPTT